MKLGLCELLDMEPKAQCKVCLSYWDVGIVYCTCGHFLRNGTEENKKFVQYTMDLLSIPNYYIKKGRLHGHRYGKKQGDHEYYIANSLKKKCKKKFYLGIHDRFIRDEKFRKNMFDIGRTEEMCREMDQLADEAHTHHITPEEISVYRNNWWIRWNTVGSDAMPFRHRPDFKQALSTLQQLKSKEDAAHQQRWQSYSSSWWNWQESWWHSSFEHHHEDGPSTDWSGKPVEKWLGYLFEVWFSELIWCSTAQKSVTVNSSLLSPTEGVKRIPPETAIHEQMAPYTHLESSSQYRILVQFKACSEKGIAILSNPIACNYSFRHTTSDVYR